MVAAAQKRRLKPGTQAEAAALRAASLDAAAATAASAVDPRPSVDVYIHHGQNPDIPE